MSSYLPSKSLLDLGEAHSNVRQLLDVCLWVLGAIQEGLGLLLQHFNFVFEDSDLVLEVTLLQLVNIDNVVISVLSNGASETNTARAVLAEAFDVLAAVIEAAEDIIVLLALLVLLAASSSRRQPTIAARWALACRVDVAVHARFVYDFNDEL